MSLDLAHGVIRQAENICGIDITSKDIYGHHSVIGGSVGSREEQADD